MILLTGANGYLGRKLIEVLDLNSKNSCLISSKYEDGFYKCDLTSTQEVQNLSSKLDPEIIIHCAASVPKKFEDYKKNSSHDDSLKMCKNIEKYFRTKLIFISSMSVYSNSISRNYLYPENLTNLLLLDGYSKAKLQSEYLFKNSANIDAINLRLPGLFSIERNNGLIFNVVESYANNHVFELEKNLPLWAAMHLNDAAQVIKYFVNNFSEVNHRTMNVGYPGKQSIPLLVSLVSKFFGKDFDIMKHSAPEFEMDLKLLKNYLNFDEELFEKRILSFVNSIIKNKL